MRSNEKLDGDGDPEGTRGNGGKDKDAKFASAGVSTEMNTWPRLEPLMIRPHLPKESSEAGLYDPSQALSDDVEEARLHKANDSNYGFGADPSSIASQTTGQALQKEDMLWWWAFVARHEGTPVGTRRHLNMKPLSVSTAPQGRESENDTRPSSSAGSNSSYDDAGSQKSYEPTVTVLPLITAQEDHYQQRLTGCL